MYKDTHLVPDQAPFVILYIKVDVCMSKIGNNIKHTRHVSRRMYFVINGEEWNLHKTVLCEVGLQLADIVTKNVREDEFNTRLIYNMVILDRW